MSCSTFSSLASSTRSSAYFTVWMICPPILKSPNPSRASLVRHLLYKLNRIGDEQYPCLTPLPVFTLLVCPRFSHTLTLWAMYKLLISLLSCQSVQVSFRICINLVQLVWSYAFCQHVKQAHNSSISNAHSDIILSIPIASPVRFPLLNPNWSSPSTCSIFLSVLLSILAAIFVVCVMTLIVRWSVHFVVFGFFTAIIVISVKSLVHSPESYYVVDQLCHYLETVFSQHFEYISRNLGEQNSFVLASVIHI